MVRKKPDEADDGTAASKRAFMRHKKKLRSKSTPEKKKQAVRRQTYNATAKGKEAAAAAKHKYNATANGKAAQAAAEGRRREKQRSAIIVRSSMSAMVQVCRACAIGCHCAPTEIGPCDLGLSVSARCIGVLEASAW